MADFTFGQTEAPGAGYVGNGESVTLNLDFWTVTTTVNILPYATSYAAAYAAAITAGSTTANAITAATTTATTSQAALNKLVQIVSTRGQPVILNAPTVSGSTYSLRFGIEHVGSWATNAQPNETIALVNQIAIDGVNYGFATGTQTATVSNSI